MTEYVEPSVTVRDLVSSLLTHLEGHSRILIAGGPRVGKSTLSEFSAAKLGVKAQHTDDTIELGWSEASLAVSKWFDKPGPWVIEGVAIPRALRKWLAANEGKPCDLIFWSNLNKVERTPGQSSMAKGVDTVWTGILPELRTRGVVTQRF
jgi:hypothetical protein